MLQDAILTSCTKIITTWTHKGIKTAYIRNYAALYTHNTTAFAWITTTWRNRYFSHDWLQSSQDSKLTHMLMHNKRKIMANERKNPWIYSFIFYFPFISLQMSNSKTVTSVVMGAFVNVTMACFHVEIRQRAQSEIRLQDVFITLERTEKAYSKGFQWFLVT